MAPLLQELPSVDAALDWLAQRGARALATDSRRVRRGDAFIAWPGYATDGRRFVGAALDAGAAACLVEAEGAAAFDFADAQRVASMPGLKARTGPLAAAFMGRPSERLQVFAVTGTNGKTSTSWWLAQALSALGRRCGVIGTLGVGEPPAGVESTGLTTPDPVTVQTAMRGFADAGFAACAIEASSIGIAEERLAGTRIEAALFTNFTQDHLDYHATMDAYWNAKARLFAWPGLRAAVLNVDDARGAALARSLGGLDAWTFSAQGRAARLRALDATYADGGLAFTVAEDDARAAVRTALIGEYNVANLLAVLGALRAAGVTLDDAARACAALTPVPGRMQRVGAGPGADAEDALPAVIVDYAHTPDALDSALRALRPLAAQRGGLLWCVFGCGGNRDALKRPLMGALAQRLADRAVVTSDNPRDESPHAIVAQIVAGFDAQGAAPLVIESRAEAIAHAVREAGARDVVLLAGKGHEDYQEIAGARHPFSDAAHAAAALGERAC